LDGTVVLAGDVGGTKTLIGLFDPDVTRPRAVAIRAFRTLDFVDLPAIIRAFLDDPGHTGAIVDAACFGVAGPLLGHTAQLTNVPWRVDALRVGRSLGIARVCLLNDLQATAYAVPLLEASEVHALQAGVRRPDGNMALIAAGTGLGLALLHNVNGRFIPSPSEGGHADFAARTERELELVRRLTARFGRVDIERVVSGPGLVTIHRALHADGCSAQVDLADAEAPAAISDAALKRTGSCCEDTLDLFVAAYGAAAGNLALQTLSTGGLFVGGGIAPKILPALAGGAFMQAFRAKSPFESLLDDMPVKVILNTECGLLGAAFYAAHFCQET
jgi:glucokinase